MLFCNKSCNKSLELDGKIHLRVIRSASFVSQNIESCGKHKYDIISSDSAINTVRPCSEDNTKNIRLMDKGIKSGYIRNVIRIEGLVKM